MIRVVTTGVIATMAVAGIAVNGCQQSQKLYQSQLSACKRGNVLRSESNRRIQAHVTDRDNLVKFAKAAARVRLDAYRQNGDHFDLSAAKLYARIVKQEQAIRFDPVAIVNCDNAIKRP